MLAAGEQQERLIDALLTLARGERGLDRTSRSTSRARRGAVAAAEADAAARDTASTPTSRTAPATGDPRLAERLAANLVDNAIRYNAAGGRVEVGPACAAGQAFLLVATTGPMIAPAELDGLLQPFQRLDAEARGDDGGLGLGLSIVHAIAEAHGATLTTRGTNRTAGLTVDVSFPAPAGGTDDAGDDPVDSGV